jgi:hypothetical protein
MYAIISLKTHILKIFLKYSRTSPSAYYKQKFVSYFQIFCLLITFLILNKCNKRLSNLNKSLLPLILNLPFKETIIILTFYAFISPNF